MEFNKASFKDLEFNAFDTIGKKWMLITAQKGDKVNTMTASWGGVGVLWNKPVAYIFIRPQRYTKEFVDSSDSLSLCVLPEEYRKELTYFGTVSGRDEDKIEKAKLSIEHVDGTPYFNESELVLICKKLYAQEMLPDCFINEDSKEKWYPEKDYHTMYVVEIEKFYKK